MAKFPQTESRRVVVRAGGWEGQCLTETVLIWKHEKCSGGRWWCWLDKIVNVFNVNGTLRKG